MAVLRILQYPDPRLRCVADAVDTFDAALATQVQDLLDTLRASGGIGLAATQVGVQRRIVAIEVSGGASDPELFINPVIISKGKPAMVEESCLSLPGFLEVVRRDARVVVKAVDRGGTPFERTLDGLAAVCLLHEVDHLDGVLFPDRVAWFKRLSLRWRLRARC